MKCALVVRTPKRTTTSIVRHPRQCGRGPVAQVSSRGATNSTPITSPIHHVHQAGPKTAQGRNPRTARLSTPLVAVTVMAIIPPKTCSPSTSRGRPSAQSIFTTRRSRRRPSSGPSVLPTAMPEGVIGHSHGRKLEATEPRKMPGHTRGPNRSSAAIAIPVGGHTAVTCLMLNAIDRPSLAAPKYVTAMTATASTYRTPEIGRGSGLAALALPMRGGPSGRKLGGPQATRSARRPHPWPRASTLTFLDLRRFHARSISSEPEAHVTECMGRIVRVAVRCADGPRGVSPGSSTDRPLST